MEITKTTEATDIKVGEIIDKHIFAILEFTRGNQNKDLIIDFCEEIIELINPFDEYYFVHNALDTRIEVKIVGTFLELDFVDLEFEK